MARIQRYWLNGETPARERLRYRVKWYEPNTDPNSSKKRDECGKRGFTTKKDAEDFARKIEQSLHDGTLVKRRDRKLTIADLAPGWIERHKDRTEESTHHPIPGTWRLWVEPTWGHMKLSEVKHTEVQRWALSVMKQRSQQTAKCALSILAGILDDAQRDGLLGTAANPARGIKFPKRTLPREIQLSPAQVRLLADSTTTQHHHDWVMVLALTGMRFEEMIGLQARFVNKTERTIRIRHVIVWVRGVAHRKPVPKTDSSYRTIAYPADLDDIMARATASKSGQNLVFTSIHGNVIGRPDSKSGWFVGSVRRAQKVDPTFNDGEKLTPHGLRHVSVYLCLKAGMSIMEVMDRHGHDSPDMVTRVYGSLDNESRRDGATKLSSLFEATRTSPDAPAKESA